ncbi:thioredoxin domain-containing protein [Tunturiibacter empetritectus]|uniref:Protein-disulfide isomerase n=1 Tax=Tunturiibacter lichenicola TaxID=2051959 RepID=A0A852VFD1_9BACT|nr:thioredoxin domain-containing protein [Edaphobacter lichenicola]NYF89164.1 protein-disulfide isomerase [Edaphobacter lichenicola]
MKILNRKISNWMLAGVVALSATAVAAAQTAAGAGAQTAPAGQKSDAPLKLQSLGQDTKADPFPPVNQKYFTASTPTVDTVNAFLKSLWGYDSNRIWRVEAIQTTSAPNVTKVIVFVSDKTPNAKVQPTAFFVTPDGKHAVAGDAVVPFGATPFADLRKTLQARADGATRGATSKDLLLVEFSDLQCPHCKDAQSTMDQLVKDFPNARVVYQSFPLVDLHPFAFKAAAYGYCVQKQKNDAFFVYSAAVFDTQAALTDETGNQTLKDAVTKAGLDPAAIDACAATPATKEQVNASIKLAQDVGVEQTPMLAVNGHLLPLAGIPYETLKTIISYQASLDGVSTGATGPAVGSSSNPPTLGK